MDSLPTPSFPYLSTAIHLAVRKVIGNECVLVLSCLLLTPPPLRRLELLQKPIPGRKDNAVKYLLTIRFQSRFHFSNWFTAKELSFLILLGLSSVPGKLQHWEFPKIETKEETSSTTNCLTVNSTQLSRNPPLIKDSNTFMSRTVRETASADYFYK